MARRIREGRTGNLASVEAAVEGGAERIELCSALSLDGLTPSLGLLQYVRERFPQLAIHVLIRPREGDFVYSRSELRTMAMDITAAVPYADGIVSGVLTAEGDVDLMATSMLVREARGLPFTFHRAFDRCRRPLVALEQIIASGCRRVLTSGQAPSAAEGIALLRRLNDLAGDRLTIMPGGGVSDRNAHEIVVQTGCCEIHGSCSGGSRLTSAQQVKAVLRAIAD